MKSKLHFATQIRQGSLLIEVSVALGLTTMLALVLMRASLLAISGNQWSTMQTLTDAYLSRETALANRLPFVEVAGQGSAWPAPVGDATAVNEQTVTLGKLPGGQGVSAILKRFRTWEADSESSVALAVWRLHSVLIYRIGEDEYTKSRSTLRVQ